MSYFTPDILYLYHCFISMSSLIQKSLRNRVAQCVR